MSDRESERVREGETERGRERRGICLRAEGLSLKCIHKISPNSVAFIFDQVAALLAFLCLDQKHYLDDILSARFSCLNDMYLTQVTKGR